MRANISEFPWQVAIKRMSYYGGHRYMMASCGGSIINNQWILTAAHCVYNQPDVHSYKVYLGFSALNELSVNQWRIGVNKIVSHEGFDYKKRSNDLSLIKLNETIDFNNKHHYLQPVCLSSLSNEWTDDNCIATGYGYQDKYGISNNQVLMKVSEPIYDITYCSLKMRDINKDSNICAGGSPQGGTSTCKGDSGGPLQCRSNDGKWYQIGITSWGEPCAHKRVPDVFTRVAYFRDWIENVIQNN